MYIEPIRGPAWPGKPGDWIFPDSPMPVLPHWPDIGVAPGAGHADSRITVTGVCPVTHHETAWALVRIDDAGEPMLDVENRIYLSRYAARRALAAIAEPERSRHRVVEIKFSFSI